MNITELARRLKIPTKELKERLPELGFDIGMRAIKVDDRLANKIIEKWKAESRRRRLEEKVLADKEKLEDRKETSSEVKRILLPPVISVRDLAGKLGVNVPSLVAELMRNGVMASISDKVDYEIAAIVAEGFGIKTELGEDVDLEQKKVEEINKAVLETKLKTRGSKYLRPPVVVVMGHVDHGKTKLLDAIRNTRVVEGESGGITQHIGAYQASIKDRLITFIDTPGHEAFSNMRSRGAVVADVAILVVAADDGVQPQTIEAIKMIQDAEVPMVVAINKIDKPEANPEMVKKGLAEINIQVESWGGNIPDIEISAKEKINLDELLEMVLLVADMNKDRLMTTESGPVMGVIIESHVDKGAGPVATVLVYSGTLRLGDTFQVGDVFGKIRAMKNFQGENIDLAPPSTPVQIIGLADVPEAGSIFKTGVDLKKLRREFKKKQKGLNNLLGTDKADEAEERVNFNIIIKADVIGSLEAVVNALKDLNSSDCRINIINKGLGSITEVDVVRAHEAGAKIYGFNVAPTTKARELAHDQAVDIESADIIYRLIEDVKKELEKRLEPEVIRHELGRVEVLKIFGKRDGGIVIGGKVLEGKVRSNSKFIAWRNGKVMHEGSVSELRIGPDKRPEVNKGDECGLKIVPELNLEEGDILEFYEEEIKTKKLD